MVQITAKNSCLANPGFVLHTVDGMKSV